jgi:hypothetical protein
MAEQFLRQQGGRTGEQISAAHDYITGPWRTAEHHTPAADETMRGYTDLVAQHLAQLQHGQPAASAPAELRHGQAAASAPPQAGSPFDHRSPELEAGS